MLSNILGNGVLLSLFDINPKKVKTDPKKKTTDDILEVDKKQDELKARLAYLEQEMIKTERYYRNLMSEITFCVHHVTGLSNADKPKFGLQPVPQNNGGKGKGNNNQNNGNNQNKSNG